MANEHEKLAIAIETEIDEFLMKTGFSLQPQGSVDTIPCGAADGKEHWIRPENQNRHLHKVHGERYYERASSHAFFYQNSSLVTQVPAVESLVTTVAHENHELSRSDPIRFTHYVRVWSIIPLEYKHIDWTKVNLQGYIRSQLTWLDPEMPDFVLDLLKQTPSIDPDTLRAELEEFLTPNTRTFVLELWKHAVLQLYHNKLLEVSSDLPTRVHAEAKDTQDLN